MGAKSVPQKQRRNERERNRVNQVNIGFNRLRERVPRMAAGPNRKMSKVETLREAANYIRQLQMMLQTPCTSQAPLNYGQTMSCTNQPSNYYPPQVYLSSSELYVKSEQQQEQSPTSTSYYSDASYDFAQH